MAVLILYSKATFWKISEAICVEWTPSRNLASLGITTVFGYLDTP